ncbi:MAG: DNA methylase [Lachnospira sp.]|nr:DNA methylase [Lachnospira sp.]
MNNTHSYIAIDLKSFYASVECVERGLNPMTTNLVVADNSRTQKTICLAVSPSLKRYGIPGRARLFEVVQKVNEANGLRKGMIRGGVLTGESYEATELDANPKLAIGYITAIPRMALYMEYSTRIYNIYLKYVAPEDIHVYSVDEVFMDVTNYLSAYGMTAEQLARKMIYDVLRETGITATAGIGTNMYLCKVAMDIVAKHMEPDEYGVRIAELDEMSYRRMLWGHRPLTDFWRVGRGYVKKLEQIGIYTMGDIARCSLGREDDYYNEELLFKMFGVNAELLIDHAWGCEPCTMSDVKAYKPSANSVGAGQVLHCAYEWDKAKLIVKEMTDLLALDLVDKRLVTNQIVLTVGYDIENLTDPVRKKAYKGDITTDAYGRKIPKHAHGTANIGQYTSSSRLIIASTMELYDRIVDRNLLVRRITLAANNAIGEDEYKKKPIYEQISLFDMGLSESVADEESNNICEKDVEKERKMQQAMLDIKKRFGKNAIIKGMNLEEGATTIERNTQIGGHKA